MLVRVVKVVRKVGRVVRVLVVLEKIVVMVVRMKILVRIVLSLVRIVVRVVRIVVRVVAVRVLQKIVVRFVMNVVRMETEMNYRAAELVNLSCDLGGRNSPLEAAQRLALVRDHWSSGYKHFQWSSLYLGNCGGNLQAELSREN